LDFRIIIPARYESSRLPGKPLLDIAGKPMIQHVYERCVNSGAESVVIATDDTRIEDAAKQFGATVCLTDEAHPTGTDRIAEVASALEYDDEDIVVCVQGDEPMIPSASIRELAEDLAKHDNVKVASMCEAITEVDDLFNPNIVKVVLNHRSYAIYFSRAPIPWDRATFNDKSSIQLNGNHFRHIGMYAYRVGFLRSYVDWADCPIESTEALEQLRVLWHGGRIHMCVTKKQIPPGIDTEEDLKKVRAVLKAKKQTAAV